MRRWASRLSPSIFPSYRRICSVLNLVPILVEARPAFLSGALWTQGLAEPWQKTLMCFLVDAVGVRVLASDRNDFIWAWLGNRMVGCVHAGGVLFGVSTGSIRVGFMRIMKLRY